uniref:Uncharacterized protein n=1 Tax=Ditylenchus dipsaci TaxID=166011 RepID=A0A915E4L3_9BILA
MPHRGRLNLRPRGFLQPPQQTMCLRFSSESADMKTKYITSLAIPEEDKHYLGLVDKLTQEMHQAEYERILKEANLEKAHLKESYLKELKSEQEKADLKLKYEMEILNLKLAYKTKEYLELYQIYTPRGLLERFEGLYKNPRMAYETREIIWTRAMDKNREFAKCIESNGIKRKEVPEIAMRLYSTLSSRLHGKFTKLSVNDQGQVEVEVVNISLAEKKLYQCAAQAIGYELVIKGLDDVEVLANQFGIKLNKEQLGFLEPTVWLNGETVNFYHQMIVQQNKSDLNLHRGFLARLIHLIVEFSFANIQSAYLVESNFTSLKHRWTEFEKK